MEFTEAIDAMLNGFYIRRKDFFDTGDVYYVKDIPKFSGTAHMLVRASIREDNTYDILDEHFVMFNLEDMQADDWEASPYKFRYDNG